MTTSGMNTAGTIGANANENRHHAAGTAGHPKRFLLDNEITTSTLKYSTLVNALSKLYISNTDDHQQPYDGPA